MRKPPIGTPNQ